MTATATPRPRDLDTLRRHLRQAEETADFIGEQLGWRIFTGENRDQLESLRKDAVREVETLRAAVAKALDDEGRACRECGGHSYIPTHDLKAEPCPECAAVTLRLPPTRTHPDGRPLKYLPAVRRMTVGSGKKAFTYSLAEFTPDADWQGRAWTLTKLDGSDAYRVLIARVGTSCDCGGACYEAVAKGNERAYWARGDIYGTDVCKHVSAVRLLLNTGLLDGKTVPAAQPETDPFA